MPARKERFPPAAHHSAFVFRIPQKSENNKTLFVCICFVVFAFPIWNQSVVFPRIIHGLVAPKQMPYTARFTADAKVIFQTVILRNAENAWLPHPLNSMRGKVTSVCAQLGFAGQRFLPRPSAEVVSPAISVSRTVRSSGENVTSSVIA